MMAEIKMKISALVPIILIILLKQCIKNTLFFFTIQAVYKEYTYNFE